MDNADHLARYPLADLFLDSSPYGAHTTAADSLWMNVPILTVPGHSFASRVCASLLAAAGSVNWLARRAKNMSSKPSLTASTATGSWP